MPQHIIDYLLSEYTKAVNAQVPLVVAHFVEFAKQQLEKNPPTVVTPVMTGMCLGLRDGTSVVFTEQTAPSRLGNDSYPVTRPVFNPMSDGISDPHVVPVTGKK